MSSQRYPPEFKDEAVRQVLERAYTVAEVSQRLGVSAHSLYKWVKAVKPDKSEEQAAELVEAKRLLKLPPFEAGVCHAYRGKSTLEIKGTRSETKRGSIGFPF